MSTSTAPSIRAQTSRSTSLLVIRVVGPDGKVIANADVKKNARVHVRLVQEGGRTVVDQINVEELK